MSYIVGFLVILAGISISILLEKKKTDANSLLFQRIAEHFGGTFNGARDIRNHEVHVEINERQVALTRFRSEHKRDDVPFIWHRAGVDIDISDTQTLAIYAEKLTESFKKLTGSQDIIIGRERFDKVFIIQSHDSTWVRMIMNDEVCALHLNHRKFAIRLKNKRLTVELASSKSTFEELLEMLQLLEAYAKCLEAYATPKS